MHDEGKFSCSVAHISGIPGMMESSRLTCMASQASDSGVSFIAGETLQLVCCILSHTTFKTPLSENAKSLSCKLGVHVLYLS